jgi:c-di-GMP-binding flagellar brake protein YcgR
MNPARPWPTVNQLVEVRTPASRAWLSSRVEDREDRRLVVAAPFDMTGQPLSAQPDDHVVLRWIEERGLASLETTVTGERGGRVPLWELRAEGVPSLLQRRRFARVPVMVAVGAVAGGGEHRLLSLDVAEGGLLCAAAPQAARAFEPGQPVRLTFEVNGRRLQTEAEVVRSKAARGGGATVAFRFTALARRDADHLRRFVYTRQVHLAAPGRR